jgi:hypothetical protein
MKYILLIYFKANGATSRAYAFQVVDQRRRADHEEKQSERRLNYSPVDKQ